MITIFHRAKGVILNDIDEDILPSIEYENLLWVDLINPQQSEQDAVEEFFDISLQTRQQAEEIESSSRYSEFELVTIANSSFLIPHEGHFSSEPTSFILKDGILISSRNAEMRSFGDTMRKLAYNGRTFPTGYHVLCALFESRIDLDADLLEGIGRQIAQLSSNVPQGKRADIAEDIIILINRLQEDTMSVRENVVDKQRILSGLQKSERLPNDLFPKLGIMLKDIDSLLKHSEFSFERLDYLQETFLGLANIRLSKITKTFTVASVIFMPPTLIASMYGMNFHFMPELDWEMGYPFALGLMVLSSIITVIFFKIKKLL